MEEKAALLSGAGRFLRIVLIANGIGDILLGLGMVFEPGMLAGLMHLELNTACLYLAGGWGIASFCFGALRLAAGLGAEAHLQWFVAAFGLLEGALLTAFGLAMTVVTPLTFAQVSLSTLFALTFALAYGLAFLMRRAELRRTADR